MTILVVDDSSVNLMLYRNALGALPNVDCATFDSSKEALAWIEAGHTFDIAVVDYQMPPPNGIEFIETFRRVDGHAETLTIMITADTERDVRHRALVAGANDFLTKPIDPVEFIVRIKNMLALARSRRELADRAALLKDEVERVTNGIRAREIETITRLTRAAEFRDYQTGKHVLRVGSICASVGRTIGLPENVCELLRLAAPMHDIGKVAIPDEILLKPGRLSEAEMTIMRTHAQAGYEILKDSDSDLLRCAASIALTHHEHVDGTGYPNGLVGNAIPIEGRICALADVFDALTSVRPYKHAWPLEEAIMYVDSASGTHFDPLVTRAFHECFSEIVDIKRRYSDDSQLSDVG